VIPFKEIKELIVILGLVLTAKKNHTGPLCKVCVEKDSYFNEEDIECQ
jgi:hypothetical protein